MSAVRQLRKYLQLSQSEFGARVDRTQATISEAEERGHIGREAGLAILDAWRPEMQELRLTLEDLLRDRDAAA